MELFDKALSRTREFVADHKVALAVLTTAVTTTVVNKKVYETAYKIAHGFIVEKNLTEEFSEFTARRN